MASISIVIRRVNYFDYRIISRADLPFSEARGAHPLEQVKSLLVSPQGLLREAGSLLPARTTFPLNVTSVPSGD